MNRYVVTYPTHGVQTYLVTAETAERAVELIDRPTTQRPGETRESIDHSITWCGRARARLDRARD